MSLSRSFRRWVMFVGVLVLLALFRAEASVKELQGRSGEPSRILRVSPYGQGAWEVSVLGWTGVVRPAELTERIKNALP